jgi:localization factor PodJL
MLNRKLPWSLIGVSPEAREEARRAAKEAGVPIGDWLAETIRHISAEELEGREPKRAAAQAIADTTAATGSEGSDEPAAVQSPAHGAETVAAQTSPAEFARRMEEVERRLTDRLEPLSAAIDRVGIRLDELDDRLRRLESGPSN